MTLQEFSLEFDILYNNIKSQSAPGLDEYEKSVLLTNAQESLVLDIYEGRNDKKESFEETESKRRYLDKLIKQTVLDIDNTVPESHHINPSSIFFSIPPDLLFITNEQLKDISEDTCYSDVIIDVVPIRQDEYLVHKKNPFRKPSMKGRTNEAWRFDYGDYVGRVVEILPPPEITLSQYIIRYIKKPKPIVLVDLTGPFAGLSVNGLTVATPCELDSSIHRDIVKNAVALASIAYK